MDMFLEKVKTTITKYSLLRPGDCVVVAVSGGPDSVCLLQALHTLGENLNFSLHVAHLDHMFRGKQSADEAVFVAELAKKMSVPATVEAADVPSYCRERGLSSQAGAREVRYAFLERVARDAGAARIATGHTASDQAETFLLRLLRGSGVSGLSSIPPVRGAFIRPLLEVTREDVEDYLRRTGSPSMTDPSNAEPVYARNRIRLDLIPVLKQFNPRIVETLAAEAGLLRDEDAAADACLEERSRDILDRADDSVSLERKEFNTLPRALRRRLIRKAFALAGGTPANLSQVQVDEALDFMKAAQTGRSLQLPFGIILLREYGRFLVRRPSQAVSFAVPLAVPGSTAIVECGLEVETIIYASVPGEREEGLDTGNYLWQAQFDYDKLGHEISVRNRKAGDRFCPAGMGGKSKKLQDFFVDNRVPRSRRDNVLLLTTREDIVWVLGMRTDERFLPGPATKRVLLVTVRRP